MRGSEHVQDLLVFMNVGSQRTHLVNIIKIIFKMLMNDTETNLTENLASLNGTLEHSKSTK